MLREECMKPLAISINGLALELQVPVTRSSQIVNERRGITADQPSVLAVERTNRPPTDLLITGYQRPPLAELPRSRGDAWAYAGISSPFRGAFPPFRLMILSKALKSARACRSEKYFAVCSADTFSATAVATNWLILVRSSRLNRSTVSLSERGNRKG